MSGKANLSLYVHKDTSPDARSAFVKDAKAAYVGFDSDGDVQVIEYTGGIDEATSVALATAKDTTGADLLVIHTAFDGDQDRTRALLNEELGDDMVVYVPDSDDYDRAFADELDNRHPLNEQIDVVLAADLGEPSIAHAEVAVWHNTLTAV